MSEEGTTEHLASSSLTIKWGSGVGDPGPQVSAIKEGSGGKVTQNREDMEARQMSGFVTIIFG